MKNKYIKNIILLAIFIAVVGLIFYLFIKPSDSGIDTEKVRLEFNDYVKQINEDGTYSELEEIWFNGNPDQATVELSNLTGENGTLRLGTITQKPLSYVYSEKRIGFSIDLLYRFCLQYGYGLEIDDYGTSSGMISALQMGKCDIIGGNTSITEERKLKVDFSDPYYYNYELLAVRAKDASKYSSCDDLAGKTIAILAGSGLVVRINKVFPPSEILEYNTVADMCQALSSGKVDAVCYDEAVLRVALEEFPDLVPAFTLAEEEIDTFGFGFPKIGENNKQSVLMQIKDSFTYNFVEGGRYKLVLKGVFTTLLITLCSAIIGTVLGFLLFLITDKDNIIIKLCSWISDGLPMIVLLMIFYYIIFGNTDWSGVTVSTIVFTLTFTLSVVSVLRNAVSAVDVGQFEVSYALGYTKLSAFFKVILPQALVIAWPNYQTLLISQIKATAIVGYIAVQDLTKAGDMIRNITFEAFFPLLTVALIYFIAVGLLILCIKLLKIKTGRSEKKSERFLNGVKQHD